MVALSGSPADRSTIGSSSDDACNTTWNCSDRCALLRFRLPGRLSPDLLRATIHVRDDVLSTSNPCDGECCTRPPLLPRMVSPDIPHAVTQKRGQARAMPARDTFDAVCGPVR